MSGMSFFLSEIRRKTGIRDTKDHKECRDYLKHFASFTANLPSADELFALRLLMAGSSLEAMAYKLHLPQEQITTFLDTACRSVGILTRDERARKIQVRQYITSHFPISGVIFTPARLAVLRGVADGKPLAQIADEVNQPTDWVEWTLKDLTKGLGLVTRGRDVMRTLIQTFLKVREVRNPSITMDDPAF